VVSVKEDGGEVVVEVEGPMLAAVGWVADDSGESPLF
jgi:hypothetical protein